MSTRSRHTEYNILISKYLSFYFTSWPYWMPLLFDLSRDLSVWQQRSEIFTPYWSPVFEINDSNTCKKCQMLYQLLAPFDLFLISLFLPAKFSSGINLFLIWSLNKSKCTSTSPSWGTPPFRLTGSPCAVVSKRAGKSPGSYNKEILSPRNESPKFCVMPHSDTWEKLNPCLWHWKVGTFQMILKFFWNGGLRFVPKVPRLKADFDCVACGWNQLWILQHRTHFLWYFHRLNFAAICNWNRENYKLYVPVIKMINRYRGISISHLRV